MWHRHNRFVGYVMRYALQVGVGSQVIFDQGKYIPTEGRNDGTLLCRCIVKPHGQRSAAVWACMADEADCNCWILPANTLAGMADSRVVRFRWRVFPPGDRRADVQGCCWQYTVRRRVLAVAKSRCNCSCVRAQHPPFAQVSRAASQGRSRRQATTEIVRLNR